MTWLALFALVATQDACGEGGVRLVDAEPTRGTAHAVTATGFVCRTSEGTFVIVGVVNTSAVPVFLSFGGAVASAPFPGNPRMPHTVVNLPANPCSPPQFTYLRPGGEAYRVLQVGSLPSDALHLSMDIGVHGDLPGCSPKSRRVALTLRVETAIDRPGPRGTRAPPGPTEDPK